MPKSAAVYGVPYLSLLKIVAVMSLLEVNLCKQPSLCFPSVMLELCLHHYCPSSPPQISKKVEQLPRLTCQMQRPKAKSSLLFLKFTCILCTTILLKMSFLWSKGWNRFNIHQFLNCIIIALRHHHKS